MRYLIILFCFISFGSCASPCQEIKAQVWQKKRANGNVIKKSFWVDLPEVLSLHSGTFHKLKTNSKADTLKLTYAEAKKKHEASFNIVEGQVEINFSKWLDSKIESLPGTLKLELLNKNKMICSKEFSLPKGD
ncbi:hypothetical protein HBN50_05645 [Halobacteriovorax sp. GB3]|uniref:hypothetical protein n=1 Tax=Halobacteriovorax sp. GB3 TaxID=2719615 RepID=UPI00235DCDF5|nr:hypothetical protein [Halobacteriovorax sp. GB3]MDD0852571.1 hypothetical protein [Halobacteriovorax sp. GB3]